MPSLTAAVEIERRILSKCQSMPGLGDVAALGAVDRVDVADAFAVLRILPVRDVDDVVDDHRRADHFVAGLRPHRVLRVGVELPQLLAATALRSRAPSRRPARAPPAARRRCRRPPASTTGRAGSCRRPSCLPTRSLPVSISMRDDRRRLRRRHVDVAFVLAVAGAAVEQVAVGDRRPVGEVVRERAHLLDHVERPDDVGVVLAGQLLVLDRAVVLVVVEALQMSTATIGPRFDMK